MGKSLGSPRVLEGEKKRRREKGWPSEAVSRFSPERDANLKDKAKTPSESPFIHTLGHFSPGPENEHTRHMERRQAKGPLSVTKPPPGKSREFSDPPLDSLYDLDFHH